MFPVPLVILARNHLFPSRKFESGYVGDTALHSGTMLASVRALHLDFDETRPYGCGNRHPRVASDLPGVHRIGHHSPPEQEVISRHRVSRAITRIIHGLKHHVGVAECLFDGIDPDEDGAYLRGQLPGDGSLACAGQAAKDDEHQSYLSNTICFLSQPYSASCLRLAETIRLRPQIYASISFLPCSGRVSRMRFTCSCTYPVAPCQPSCGRLSVTT